MYAFDFVELARLARKAQAAHRAQGCYEPEKCEDISALREVARAASALNFHRLLIATLTEGTR